MPGTATTVRTVLLVSIRMRRIQPVARHVHLEKQQNLLEPFMLPDAVSALLLITRITPTIRDAVSNFALKLKLNLLLGHIRNENSASGHFITKAAPLNK